MLNVKIRNSKALSTLKKDPNENVASLSTEEILLRWVNRHLANSGQTSVLKSFGRDIGDSLLLSILMAEVFPERIQVEKLLSHLMPSAL